MSSTKGKNLRRLGILFLVAVCGVMTSAVAQAASRWVASNGSLTRGLVPNDCLKRATPCPSIAVAHLWAQQGDVIQVLTPLTEYDVVINKQVTISGSKATVSPVSINAAGAGRHFTIYADGVVLTQLSLSGGSRSAGGSLHVNGGVTLIDTQVTQNEAVSPNGDYDNGGGIWGAAGSSIVVTGFSVVERNRALNGGGIYTRGEFVLTGDAEISTNTANGAGGGLYSVGNLSSQPSANVDGTVSGNRAETNGGGIFCGQCTLVTDHAAISTNTAQDFGAGIYGRASDINVTHTVIDSNSSVTGTGAGIYVTDDSELTVFASMLNGNIAGGTGGGICAYNAKRVTLERSSLGTNTAALAGGGIWMLSEEGSILNSTFYSNSAQVGGAIFNFGTPLGIEHATVVNNSANDGPAMTTTVRVALNNSIFENNDDLSVNFPNLACSGQQTAAQRGVGHSNLIGADGTNNDTSCGVDSAQGPFNLGRVTGLAGTPSSTGTNSVSEHFLLVGTPSGTTTVESNAVDRGVACVLLDDQRGINRFDGLCDVGSVEKLKLAPVPMP